MAIFNSAQILAKHGGTCLASYLYEFICKMEHKCNAYRAPTMTDLLNEVVEHSRDEISLAHNINKYMMKQAAKVIYRSINRDCRDVIEQKLQVNKKINEKNPELDNCEFIFLHHRVLGTNVELLIGLQRYIEEYAMNLVSNDIQANVTYSYEQGQIKEVLLANGEKITWNNYTWQVPTQINFPGSSQAIIYDPLQRPLSIKVTDANNNLLINRSYSYDKEGNITQQAVKIG